MSAFDNIPQELRALRQWVLWRKEPKEGRPGEFKKVPYYVNGTKRHGKQGSPADREALATYEAALAAHQRDGYDGGGYDGIGIAMSADSDIIGLDVDDCYRDGRYSPEADEIARACDTYGEISPSGKGLRFFYRGSMPDASVKGYIEVFHGKGFLTVTGDRINGAEILPMPDNLRRRIEQLIATKKGDSAKPKPSAEPQGDVSLERIRSALQFLKPDADDRDLWLKYGWAIARATDRSEGGFECWYEWATQSAKHDPARDRLHMRKEYFEKSAEPRANPVTVATIFKRAREAGWRPEDLRDADHYRLAQAFVDALKDETGEPPVYAQGALWALDGVLWRSKTLDAVAVEIGRMFGGGKHCKRGSDFNAVARLVSGIAADDAFFEAAAVGIAGPSAFWRVTPAGEIVSEPLSAAHRQRVRLAADPDRHGEPTRFLNMLREAFAEKDADHAEEQIELLQQLFGCAITRSLWRHRIAALLLGPTSSGKSTCLHILMSAFPRDQIAATSPERWDNEYYVAALAGRALNIVGELDGRHAIPGGAFKRITGRDVIEGRHPTHRPFSFICEAAHFFNANRTPPTTDHSDAFFRRWRVVQFLNTVPPDREQRDLDQQIADHELGAFLWWALAGAAQVAKQGAIRETERHRRALARWRVETNSALAFLHDRAECELLRDASDANKARFVYTVEGQEFFRTYANWAASSGVKAFGRNGLYEALRAGGGVAGVRVVEEEHQVKIEGVRLCM